MPLLTLQALGGVASCRTLEAHGVTPAAIAAAVRRGDVLRVRQGWLALPRADRDVVAAVRVGGHLTCTSVLAKHDIWCERDERLHVRTRPTAQHLGSPIDRSRSLAPRHPVVVHRTGRLALPTAAIDDLPSAVAVAMTCQNRFNAIATLDCLLNKRIMSTAQLHEVLAPMPASARGYLALTDAGSQSGLETKARLSFRGRGITVRTQVHISGVGRVDMLIGDRLVIEVDGYRWHSSRSAFAEDRRRDLELARQGYLVIRLTYDQVMFGWAAVEEVVLAHLRRREHLWAVRHRRAGFGTD
ncbi:endonuclease domain-containing protein [Herbiconiux daphne]|uniref:DUF559 domain-containing protein n=1 Tax=Herbiconiux daphne TaxID=2970914 RepID=A0ABT2H0X5_9MICO|nr:DUF559 domain-containing protein [Herbiconiux daphne]MCS5733589.1 DUF559 domain-containing protein [Herbiconiux daphne]